MSYWSLKPIFGSYLVVLLLTGLMIGLLFVLPRFARLKPYQTRALLLIRFLLILLVSIAMLRPTRVSTSSEAQSSVLIVLGDQSRSMNLPNAAGDRSRWEEQKAALQRVAKLLGSRKDNLEVRGYTYDSELQGLNLDNANLDLPLQASGEQTDIGSTLYEAVQKELGRPVSGVIVLGDGAQNAFTPRIEVQQAAREIGRLDYPLYAVVFGQSGDSTQVRDVGIENLPERYTVFVKNEMTLAGAVRVRGFVNQSLPIELEVESSTGEKQKFGPVNVVAQSDNQLVPFQMSFVPAVAGEYKLTVRAPSLPGETITQNNELRSFLTVLEGGLRVLYLFGDLLGEQRLLRRSLTASPDMQVDALFVDVRGRSRWPLTADLQLSQYDVLILENVDASALLPQLPAIASWVNSGRGLLMIGGFHSFGPGGYRGTPLADALPIEMGRFERQDIDPRQPIRRDLHWWGELRGGPAQEHPVTRLGPAERNAAIWQSLPPLRGANKLTAKGTGRVLLRTSDNKPLLVSGLYGNGRVLAFAGNSTGLWWQYGRSSEHRRFWRQAVLWLARREDNLRNDVWIKLDRRRLNPGETLEVSAGARNAQGDPITDVEVNAELVLPSGVRRPIQWNRESEQFFQQLGPLSEPGDYQISLLATANGEQLGAAQASFEVLDRDLELSNPAANLQLMSRLADATKAAGGRVIASEELAGILEEIEARSSALEIEVQTKWQLGDTSLDAWLLFLVLVALISVEWVLRRRWGLV